MEMERHGFRIDIGNVKHVSDQMQQQIIIVLNDL